MKQLQHFVKTRWQEILITGVFLQSFIAAVFTLDPLIIVGTTLGGLVLLIIVFEGVNRLQQRRHQPQRGENIAFQTPRRAVVFTVGGQSFTIEQALDNQAPEFAGFLCSQQTEYVADDLISRYGFDPQHYKKELVDPQNIVEIRAKTGFILDWLVQNGLAREDTVVDVTGGLTPISVGAFSVAEERQIDSQYIKSDYDGNNRPIPGTQEAVFVSRYTDLSPDTGAARDSPNA